MSGSEIKCVICHDSPQDKEGAWTDGRSFVCLNCRKHINVDWGKPEGDISVTGDYAPTGIVPSFPQKPELFPEEIVAVIPVEIAVNVLAKALKDDPGYRETYKANIAMCFKDEFVLCENKYIGSDQDISSIVHDIANRAADRFLDLFIGGKKSDG